MSEYTKRRNFINTLTALLLACAMLLSHSAAAFAEEAGAELPEADAALLEELILPEELLPSGPLPEEEPFLPAELPEELTAEELIPAEPTPAPAPSPTPDPWAALLAGIEIQSMTVVNPVYSGLIDESEIPTFDLTPEDCARILGLRPAQADGAKAEEPYGEAFALESDSGTYYTSVEEAGAEVKQYVKAREAEIRIHFVSTERLEWKSLCSQIYASAVAHTGVPTEGDYLRFEYGGYTAKGSGPLQTGSTYTYLFVYTPYYYTTAEQELEMDAAVGSVLAKLALDGKSDYEKVEAIYRYLCENVSYYSGSGTLRYTGYAALVQGSAVCQGYAVSFYRLCLEVGVYPVRVISSANMVHAWNIYQVGDYYYLLDPTWDATNTTWKWFLCGSRKWLAQHFTNGYAELGDQYTSGNYGTLYPLSADDCGTPCVITYDANGGTGAPASQIKGETAEITLSAVKPTRANKTETPYKVTLIANGGTVSTTSLTAERTTRYTFQKWNTSKNGTGSSYYAGGAYTAKTGATLYAQWNGLTITSSVTLPTPTRTGYFFRGWAASATASTGKTGSYIPAGNETLYALWEQDPVAAFVKRCYEKALNREAEEDGLVYWTDVIRTRQTTPEWVGYFFVFSDEGAQKGQSNYGFITMLYRLYMDREPDLGGISYWNNILDSKILTRQQVNDYFGTSPEFQNIKASYGL